MFDFFKRKKDESDGSVVMTKEDVQALLEDYNKVKIATEEVTMRYRGLVAWLKYIRDSDSSVVPAGFHESCADAALKGAAAPEVKPYGRRARGIVRPSR